MHQMRWACYMDSGGSYSRAAPVDAVHRAQQRSAGIGAGREGDTANAVVAAEELVAGDAGEQCSRAAAVASDAEAEDPAARGGDDGDLPRPQPRVPLCILHSVDGPLRVGFLIVGNRKRFKSKCRKSTLNAS